MLIVFLLQLFSLNASANLSNPDFVLPRKFFIPTPGKKTVCTITINSDEEKNEFLKALDKKRFDFVELVPTRTESSGDDDPEKWFDDACDSKIQCDMVVVSGHFGGTFFGASGKKLSLNTLNTKSCAKSCNGILSHPAEVFLFGCNTLAGKKADSRSPEDYLKVLLADGFSSQEAMQIVEGRYGIFSFDNRSQMIRVFNGVSRIYGFSSIAPSGKHVQDSLSHYLNTTGNYEAHLNSLKSSNTKNSALLMNLNNTAIDEAIPAAERKMGEDALTSLDCKLRDAEATIESKKRAILEVLAGPKRLSALTIVANFIQTSNQVDQLTDLTLAISTDQELKEKVVNALRLSQSPHFVLEYSKLVHLFSWLSRPELQKVLNEKFLKPIFTFPIRQEYVDLYVDSSSTYLEGMDIVGDGLITEKSFLENMADPVFLQFVAIYDVVTRGRHKNLFANVVRRWRDVPVSISTFSVERLVYNSSPHLDQFEEIISSSNSEKLKEAVGEWLTFKMARDGLERSIKNISLLCGTLPNHYEPIYLIPSVIRDYQDSKAQVPQCLVEKFRIYINDLSSSKSASGIEMEKMIKSLVN